LNFNFIDKWIIVYDGNKIKDNYKLFADDVEKDKISEYTFKGQGISGNPQRNFALEQIKDENTYLYFLDDDNIVHQDLYKLLNIIGDSKFCTFNQKRGNSILTGDKIQHGYIDTAMFIINFRLCKSLRWNPNLYESDYHYIKDCYDKNKPFWVYVNNEISYYNYLA
jgi:hypothetical protein